MTKGLRTAHYAVSVAVIAAVLLFGGNLSAPATFSSEVGFSSFSPRGAAGGAVIPASCESGFEHFPGECPPPPTASLTADPGTIIEGNSSTLSWTSSNATSCSIDQGIGGVPLSGSEPVSPLSTTTYTLSCTGPGGSAQSSAQVSVIPRPSVDLKVNGSDGPLSFEALAGYTVSWTSTNADSCSASGAWSGARPVTGSEGFSDVSRGTYDYTLTCAGPGGQDSDSVQVTVIQVPQCTFAPNPGSIILPETATLSWSCQFADSCSIDQGVGAVNPVSGNREVQPQETTLYTLTCQGTDGARSYPGTVRVFSPSLKEVLPK